MNESFKNTTLLLLFFGLTVYSVFDKSNVIGNGLYYLLVVLIILITAIVMEKCFKILPFKFNGEKLLSVFLIVLCINAIVTTIPSILLSTLTDKSKKILLSGKIIEINYFDKSAVKFIGSYTGYNVTFMFDSGDIKTWKVRNPKGIYYKDNLYYSDFEIVENYKMYNEIKVIAHDGILGRELLHFSVE